MDITVTIDTHEFIEELRTAGFGEQQAEVLSEAMRKAQDARMDQLATKGDLSELKEVMVQIDRRMDRLEAKFKLMKWMSGVVLVGIIGIIAMLAKVLVSLPH